MSTKLTWFGHSTVGIEVGGYRLVIDPFFTDNPTATISADQVQVDFILLSHGHSDHLGDTINLARRTGALVITNFEIGNWLDNQGIQNHSQHIGGGYRHPFGYLKLTQAVHGSGLPDGSYGGSPAGFLLYTQDDKKIYVACDTGLFGDMRMIGDEGLDLAVLPIGDNYTMGPDDALRAVKLLRPKMVIPVHYDTWELIAQDPKAWAKRVEAETEAKVSILSPGESYYV